jgi:hypothetical protein
MRVLLIALGMGLASAYAGWAPVRTFLTPFSELLIALRPLLVPVLVLLASFTVNIWLGFQVAAGLVLVLVVHGAIVRPERDRSSDLSELSTWWHAIEHGISNTLKKLCKIGIPTTLVIWLVISAVGFGSGIFRGQGGLAAALLVVALGALTGALLVRLHAYANTWLRRIVALLLATATFMAVGGVAGVLWDWKLSAPLSLAAAVGAALALLATLAAEWIKQPVLTAAQTKRKEELYGLGMFLSVLSGVSLMGATTLSLLALDNPLRVNDLDRDLGPHPRLYTGSDKSPEYQYAPVLAFTRDERWTPDETRPYFNSAHVERRDGSVAPPGEYTCPSVGPRACLRVTIGCRSVADGCTGALPEHKGSDPVTSGAIYVRTLRRPKPDDQSNDAVALRTVFRPLTATAARTDMLLQYWLFYPYDEWTTKILGARLTQRHEGDWESVAVGLDARRQPLFVAYSAHCGGTWERWGATKHFRAHPLVAVANGSHANYPEAGAQRPPDFTSCKRLPRGVGTLLGFAANVRDRTSDDWEWGAARVISVTEKDWPMRFPGTWGGNDVTQFKNARTFTSAPGGGPASPPLQALWQDPITTIFCDRYWDGPEPCRK